MATKTILTCDMCGKEPANTVALAVGATTGNVDLCDRHAKALTVAAQPYLTVARTNGRTSAKGTSSKALTRKAVAKKAASRTGLRRSARGSNVAAIRNWGWENGFEVATRGRLKPDLVTAYTAAHATPAAEPAAPAAKATKPRAKKTAKTPAKRTRPSKAVAKA